MKNSPHKFYQKKSGFISIIALGVFALLAVFGIIVQLTVMDTYSSVRNNNNYYSSRDLADSVVEYLQFKLNSHDSGFSYSKKCEYETDASGKLINAPTDECKEFNKYMENLGPGKEVSLDIKVVGRPVDGQEIKTGITSLSGAVYVVPFPGTGDAGKNCDSYEPFDSAEDNFVAYDLVGNNSTDHADFSCNWNKLTFGSSLTDRVAIPLYYDESSLTESAEIVNPYKGGDATKFFLRIRTPCDEEKTKKSDCASSDRYLLDDTKDEIVVQWQLNGQCTVDGKEEECGMIAIPEVDEDDEFSLPSAIFEYLINKTLNSNNVLLNNDTQGYDIGTNNQTKVGILAKKYAYEPSPKLSLMSKPILTLFLSDSLISKSDLKNIPYLEYQFLSDFPVGNSKLLLEVTINIDGNTFKRTLTKEVSKPLIDFAIQN